MARKTSRGRQRIAMEKMKNQSSLQVTFSKRRSGIMKKCNELSTLTGAEMVVVIFSPGSKAFSFGNPSVETILNRFQNLQIPNNDYLTERSYQLHLEDKLKDLAEKMDLLKEEHEAERKLKQHMDQISEIEEKNNNLCLEDSVVNLNEGQLEKLKDAFQDLNKMTEKKIKTQNNNLEIQREPPFHFQNVFEHHHDAHNIENARGGHIATFADYAASRNAFGLTSHIYATTPSTFGGSVFQFNQGQASCSNNNGVLVAAPANGTYAGTSSFGGSGFHFILGGVGASISNNNGVQVNLPPLEATATAPAVVTFVLPHYVPIQGYLPLF